MNLVSPDQLNPDGVGFFNDSMSRKVSLWLFFWSSLGFGAIAGGITIMAVKYNDNWLGWSILLQPILVFIRFYFLILI